MDMTTEQICPWPREGAAEITDRDRLLSVKDVLSLMGISRTQLWQGVKDGRYPEPIRFGPRTTRWRLSDIRACVAEAERAARAA
jgi:predicted DNA-binding transcriptional regulator AlpA